MIVLLLLLASWLPLYGQVSLAAQAPPSPVVGAGAIGARGGSVLYYWVVARYPAGSSSPSTAAMALNTVGALNLTVSNFVRVSWSAMAGATGYDVIRSSSPMMPASCVACAVVLNTSSTTVDDTTPTGSAWPAVGIPVGVPVGGYLTINNRDDATPYLNFQLMSTRINELTRVGLILGTPAENDCIKYSAGRLVSAGAACGSGGGGGMADPGGNGIMARTALNVSVARTLTAGPGISITNADGVAGNPEISATGGAASPFAPTRETGSSTNDTLRLNCDVAPYCSETINKVVAYTSTTDLTFKISTTPAYTGNLYTYYTPPAQTIYCDQGSAGLTLTLAGCTAATNGGIPAGSVPVGKYDGTYAVVNNAFADPSTSPVAPTVWSRTLSGTGVDCSDNASTGEQTCVTDATIPSKTDVATNTLTYNTITGTTSLTLTTPHTISPLQNGVCVYGRMGVSNSSGTVTLAVNGTAATPVYKLNGASDASQVTSELRANTSYEFCYDGSLSSGVYLVNVGGGGSSAPAQPAFWLPGGYTEAITGPNAISPSANNTTFIAFVPDVDMDLRSVAFFIGTGSGNCGGSGCGMKVGIYDSAGILAQTAVLTNGGSPDIDSTGAKVAALTSTASLSKGALYWAGFTSNSTALALYVYAGSSSGGVGNDIATALIGSVSTGLGNNGSGSAGSVSLPLSKGTVTRDTTKHVYFGLKY